MDSVKVGDTVIIDGDTWKVEEVFTEKGDRKAYVILAIILIGYDSPYSAGDKIMRYMTDILKDLTGISVGSVLYFTKLDQIFEVIGINNMTTILREIEGSGYVSHKGAEILREPTASIANGMRDGTIVGGKEALTQYTLRGVEALWS